MPGLPPMHKSEAEHFKMLASKKKAEKAAAQKAINILRQKSRKKRAAKAVKRHDVGSDIAFDSRGKPYSVAEKLEYIRSFLSERARWKKEFEKHDIAIPRAKHPEIELTSTRRQRKRGEFTTRGARPNPAGRQADAEEQKAFGRRHPKTGKIDKEAPQVQQTGSASAKAEPKERRAQIKRIKRDKPDFPISKSWMSATADWNDRLNKAGRRARARATDPGRDFGPAARRAKREGLRKRSKSGWEGEPPDPKYTVS